MEFKGLKVLLPESSGRQVLPMAKALKKLGCKVTTVQGKKSDLGYSTRYADNKIVLADVDESLSVAEPFYLDLVEKEQFDVIIPLSDFSAGIFAKAKAGIESKNGSYVATNDYPVFMQAFDKLNTMKICMANNIPCPYTLDAVASIDDVPENVTYPVLLKPRSSCGSIGLHIAQNRESLFEYIEQVHQENLGEVLVQEFIPQTGKQYNAHFVLDKDHNVKTAILTEKCRWFPLDGGASTCCKTIHNEQVLETCSKMLKIMGWVGYCDIDLMEDPRDGVVKVIEINARISANVKLCYAVGIDITKQILELALNKDVTDYKRYKDDVCMRCLHTDLLWFLKSPNRFRTTPNWFSIARTTDQIFDLLDPKPFITFSIQAVLKYKREMKKRAR